MKQVKMDVTYFIKAMGYLFVGYLIGMIIRGLL